MHRPTLCSSLSLAALLFAASCTDAYVHPVGGTLTGLEAGTLVLALNGEDQITLSADGPFVFPRAMKQGTEFAVTVVEAPPNTQVSLANATGVVDKTIFDITVQVVPTLVIGGTLTGLDTGSVSLRLNGGAPLTVASNGAFTFPIRVPRGGAYAVTLDAPAATQVTRLSAASGVVGNADVTTVGVHCSNWQHATSIDDRLNITGGGYYAKVAIDEQGNGVAVWAETQGNFQRAFKAEFTNGVWTRPTSVADAISPDGSHVYEIEVAMLGGGDALIVWSQFDDQNHQQIFKSERRGGVWTHPTSRADNISPDGTDAYDPAVAGSNGEALVAWTQSNGPTWHVYKAELRNSAWTLPTLDAPLSLANGNPGDVRVALDGAGAALVAWVQWDGIDDDSVFKSEYRNGVWTHPTSAADRISPAGGSAYDLTLCGDGAGTFALAWTQDDGIYYDMTYAAACRQGTWTLPASLADHISPTGSWTWEPQVDARNGAITIAWTQEDSAMIDRVLKSDFRNGAWTHPASKDDGISLVGVGYEAGEAAVGVDAQGNAIITWRQWDGVAVHLLKSELVNGTWHHPTAATDSFHLSGYQTYGVRMARAANGDAIVLYSAGTNSSPQGGSTALLVSVYR